MAEVGAAELMLLQEGLSDQQKLIFASQYASEKKDRTLALILSILLGKLGIDRFYAGDIAIGILKLLTVGGCLVIWIVDWFLISGRIDDFNRRKAQEIATALRVSTTGAPAPRVT